MTYDQEVWLKASFKHIHRIVNTLGSSPRTVPNPSLATLLTRENFGID
jgi:hypothetical protein